MGKVELTNEGGKIIIQTGNKEITLQKIEKQMEITASGLQGPQGPPGPPGSFEEGNLDCGTF